MQTPNCTMGLRPCRRVDVDMPLMPASEVLPASFPRRDFSLVAEELVVQPTVELTGGDRSYTLEGQRVHCCSNRIESE